MNTRDHSILLSTTMSRIYNYIIVFGIYVILNGHITPGGGFQGGAILASVFIIHYLVTNQKRARSATLTRIEKLLYLALIIFSIVVVFYLNPHTTHRMKEISLMIMNILIGIKVSCGLTVIFYRFVFFESR